MAMVGHLIICAGQGRYGRTASVEDFDPDPVHYARDSDRDGVARAA